MVIFIETQSCAVQCVRSAGESLPGILLLSWHICARVIPRLCPALPGLPLPTYLSGPTHTTSEQKRSNAHFIPSKPQVCLETMWQCCAYRFHCVLCKLSVKKYSFIKSPWKNTTTSLTDVIFFNFELLQQLGKQVKRVTLSLCTPGKHTGESRGIAPLILSLSARWTWVVTFTPLLLYTWENPPLNVMLSGHQNQFGSFRIKKGIIFLPGFKLRILHLVTLPLTKLPVQ
jgi:hypothetical protein